VAYAIAGRVNIDLTTEPLGRGTGGNPVYLRDVWPSSAEVASVMQYATDPATYRRLYGDFTKDNPLWNEIPTSTGRAYIWDKSTYIAEPPFFEGFAMQPGAVPAIRNARALAIFGDSVTTDHISPAGSIKPASPAGIYLLANGVGVSDFNSYGSRRGNHEVMMRGTFANVRIKNLMLPPNADGSRVEGGVTLTQPEAKPMSIYDAAMAYIGRGTPTVIFAGEEYGTGSSRLGREGHAVARRESGHREKFRADPSVESGVHGRPSMPVQGCGHLEIAGHRRHRGIRRRRSRGRHHAADGRDAGRTAKGWPREKRFGALTHRHSDRSRLLPARRHSAVRPA